VTTTLTPGPPISTAEMTSFPHELHAKIRFRAYELYEERGRIDGRDLDDWLQAESEVTQAKKKVAVATAA
jgi:hypothetical protein